MPQKLSESQLKELNSQVKAGGVEAARKVYDQLYAAGYNYAGWASGVARGNSVSGQSALSFMKGTALLGLTGQAAQSMSEGAIDKLRVDMAVGYLTTLTEMASRNGFVDVDVDYGQTRNFHETAFKTNHLSLDNWTLEVPMALIGHKNGSAKVEELWTRIRDTGGDGLDGALAGLALLNQVGLIANTSPDAADRQLASQWLDRTPGIVTYVVNSVNDSVYEGKDEGHDVVISSTSYLMNANIEELRLVEGFNAHGTGNALDNKIIGNSADNILDGITGADTLVGAAGNDTYYVDNAGDKVVEAANEGVDTVQTSVNYTLGADVENMVLLDFAKPEQGLVDGKPVLVYGYPKRNELDYMQGDAVANYQGTCALTSIANLLTQTGRPTTESQVVTRAIENNWAVNDPTLPAAQLGGSNVTDQRHLLDSYGVRNDVVAGYNENGIANLVRSGRGVIIAVNAGKLWSDAAYTGNGSVNHAVTLTGAVYDATTGELAGFYLTDSGRGKVGDMTRFLGVEAFRAAANVANAYAIYTIEPVKYWEENIAGTGNALDNTLVGNRGDNLLAGLAGDDTLEGGAGSDTYQLGRGDGTDRIVENDGTAGHRDVAKFASDVASDQLWFRKTGSDLEVSIVGSNDRFVIDNWYGGSQHHVEQFLAGDGKWLSESGVQSLVDAMASFSPPAAGEINLPPNYNASLQTPLAANWH